MPVQVSNTGRAALCFPSNGTWFQGYFVCASPRIQLGLMGEEIPVDDCVACPNGGYQEYRVKVMHYTEESEVELIVRKTGGDFCRLESDKMTFQPSMLLSEEKAVEAIESYFPTIADRVEHNVSLLHDCIVVFGEMEISTLDFPSLTED